MKTMMIALAVAGLAATGSAFAQSTTTAPDQTTLAQTAVVQAGQWIPPDGQTVAPKTRAQVYQELVKAEQDGQLDYLDRTLYWHH
ncbi:hypothetical protein EOS_16095 [Caballeronia mineralivorans PML1(12)]|uniref:DUF4148 domain-containing protein n=1 Tax=Caballeronia mineralivorans PML1(12) TaxID=908627 RepID=A0A0J1CXD0_9BURK|nr:DUF4148 domain-containing protein [Caballeronia mineralivorans]KLU25207.1 hypothetical protein EOS_16095 [Caballeronia mineralivorans PML1(12)]